MASDGDILSVDIGGLNTRIGRVSPEGDVHEVETHPTETLRDGGPDQLIDYMASFVDEGGISALSVAVPATVDWEHNHVRSDCEELPWITDSANKKQIQDTLKRPLQLVNDVEALLVGEWTWGELKGYTTGTVLSLGESMGSALLWNGMPQQGRRGSIMELEHVSLNTDGESDPGMPPGSSHYWLSGHGLKNRLREAGLNTELEQLFPPETEAEQTIVKRFQDKLAHLLGTVVMMLDPERIVLAGGLTGSANHWLSPVEDRMDDFVMEQFQGLPSVELGRLRGEDVVRGPAAFWVWQNESV